MEAVEKKYTTQDRRDCFDSADKFNDAMRRLKLKLLGDLHDTCENDIDYFDTICKYGKILEEIQVSFNNEFKVAYKLFEGDYAGWSRIISEVKK